MPDKIARLEDLVESGLQEAFQLIWSTVAYDDISPGDLHSIERASVSGPDIGFLKFAVAKGYFQVQDLYKLQLR